MHERIAGERIADFDIAVDAAANADAAVSEVADVDLDAVGVAVVSVRNAISVGPARRHDSSGCSKPPPEKRLMVPLVMVTAPRHSAQR